MAVLVPSLRPRFGGSPGRSRRRAGKDPELDVGEAGRNRQAPPPVAFRACALGSAQIRIGEGIMGRPRLRTAVIAAALVLGAGPALTQDYPSKPVRIITGFAAGGIGDLGARLLAEFITRTTGQQAFVENRTGAAGTIGMDAVAKATPDGTTLGLALNGNLVINPFIQKQMPFDAQRDLVPVAAIGEAPQMIAINADVPAKAFREFQALAKAKPGTFAYGSAGPGSLPHLSAAEFA